MHPLRILAAWLALDGAIAIAWSHIRAGQRYRAHCARERAKRKHTQHTARGVA